ncbi:MAG TPA: hypothetical protein PLI98_15075 [Candidatus Hydrogenedentes bacterium]|nr:hypothetical protein [Candidatus Hydrogenedentota bacterium]
MKLVSLQDNPQFLKGFYLRTRFPEVIFEPVLVALALVVFLVVPSSGGPVWSVLAAFCGGVMALLLLLLAPAMAGRMAAAEVREGTLDFYRAAPLYTRNHVVGLIAGAVFPEWVLSAALALVFLPVACAMGIPWHLALAFVASLAMTGALAAAAVATAALHTRENQGSSLRLLVILAVGFWLAFALLGAARAYFQSLWVFMTGIPLVNAVIQHAALDREGFSAGHSLVLVMLQAGMQLPLFLLCWVNIWRVFRGPRWYNSRKLQAVLVAVYAFFCMIPDDASFWRPKSVPLEYRNSPDRPSLAHEPQEAAGVIASGVTALLLIGTMLVGSPETAQVARGLRRARKAGKRGVSWLDDCAVSAPAMLAVTGVCLLAQGALYIAGFSEFTPQMALGFLLLCLNLLFLALFYQCVQIGWGARGRKLFMFYIIAAWVVLPMITRFSATGLLLSPWLPFTVLIVGAGVPLGTDLAAEATAATVAALVLNAALACAAAVVLRNQYRRLKEQVFGA